MAGGGVRAPVRGRLIAFEGTEGAGKSTHAAWLAGRLRELGLSVLLTAEPGATPLGREIRRLVLHDDRAVPSPRAELLLYLADRAEHVARRIAPALAGGVVVVSDRFNGSTLAYQGYGRGIGLGVVRRLDAFARDGVRADLTILLDCPPEEGLRRARGADRFHREDVRFHRRVRKGFLDLARGDRARWYVVDSRRPREEVRARIERRVVAYLRRAGLLAPARR